MEQTNGGSTIPIRRRLRSVLRLAGVRLRLPAVLIVAAVVVGRWDTLCNHWDRLTRTMPAESLAGRAISEDTEYFCPMDPGVISNWPGRCGVCNMALVRRKKGEADLLPVGVVARMQLSPYRIQLAGLRTEAAGFRPLAREWSGSGFVFCRGEAAIVEIDLPPGQAPWIDEDSQVDVTCSERPGETFRGRVSLSSRDGGRVAAVRIEAPPRVLREGLIATVRSSVPVASIEPFRSMPHDPPAPRPGEPRQLYRCADHYDSTALRSGRCPLDGKDRRPISLGALERVRWWCPMHPDITADAPGATCRACNGMELRPRAIVYAPPGQVLAVPQSAVVDTGERKVVFVEEMPGMFVGVEVVLGPRCGAYYPVVKGVEPGHRIAIAGAFLLDAETRLNPALAASYFGANGGRSRPAAEIPGPKDRPKTCPVTGRPLGSMGAPVRVEVAGRVVFLCCDGCRSKLLAEPGKYLDKP